jgi:hypothetical protein
MARDFVPALAADALRGRWRLLEPLLDLTLLPLAYHVVLTLLTLIAPDGIVRNYGLLALGLVAAHVLTGIAVGGGGIRDVAALAVAPFYVGWKLAMLPLVWRASRRNAEWVRTERAGAGEAK